MEITVSREILMRVPSLRLYAHTVSGVSVRPSTQALDMRAAQIIDGWLAQPDGAIDAHPRIVAYRDLHQALGVDADRMPPAAENLLRRVIQARRLPRINSVVDAANVTSLEHLVPIGAFDLNAIKGDMELGLAASGDELLPIGRKDALRLQAGTPVLRDGLGIFSAIGFRDSQRTMIREETSSVLLVSWGNHAIDPDLIVSVWRECEARIS